MLKSENDGTSIDCAYITSVIAGKSFIAVNVTIASTLVPVPNFLLVGTKNIFLEP